MAQTRIQIAKPDIVDYFDKHQSNVFKLSNLKTILSEQRAFWRLAQRTTCQEFIQFLTTSSKLQQLDFPFPHRKETRYTWGNVPLLEILLTLKPNGYFSHYTAVRLHGLTEQVPKTIYFNHEQHLKSQSTGELEQGKINAAFSRPHRMTNNVIQFGDVSICLINGKNTGELGVVTQSMQYESDTLVQVRVTNIERTLIDITVRPSYAGGPFEVLKAYSSAQGQVSVNALVAMLKKIQHTYPYHQAIGYYLERAGYKTKRLRQNSGQVKRRKETFSRFSYAAPTIAANWTNLSLYMRRFACKDCFFRRHERGRKCWRTSSKAQQNRDAESKDLKPRIG